MPSYAFFWDTEAAWKGRGGSTGTSRSQVEYRRASLAVARGAYAWAIRL
jgi:hypothetical protein